MDDRTLVVGVFVSWQDTRILCQMRVSRRDGGEAKCLSTKQITKVDSDSVGNPDRREVSGYGRGSSFVSFARYTVPSRRAHCPWFAGQVAVVTAPIAAAAFCLPEKELIMLALWASLIAAVGWTWVAFRLLRRFKGSGGFFNGMQWGDCYVQESPVYTKRVSMGKYKHIPFGTVVFTAVVALMPYVAISVFPTWLAVLVFIVCSIVVGVTYYDADPNAVPTVDIDGSRIFKLDVREESYVRMTMLTLGVPIFAWGFVTMIAMLFGAKGGTLAVVVNGVCMPMYVGLLYYACRPKF